VILGLLMFRSRKLNLKYIDDLATRINQYLDYSSKSGLKSKKEPLEIIIEQVQHIDS
jgi:hypothetical protein